MDLFSSIPTHMDFKGQDKSERLSRMIVVLFGAVGIVWGYVLQQFSQTVYILAAGLALAALLTVPPWPFYRRNPVKWQKPRKVDNGDKSNSKKKK